MPPVISFTPSCAVTMITPWISRSSPRSNQSHAFWSYACDTNNVFGSSSFMLLYQPLNDSELENIADVERLSTNSVAKLLSSSKLKIREISFSEISLADQILCDLLLL